MYDRENQGYEIKSGSLEHFIISQLRRLQIENEKAIIQGNLIMKRRLGEVLWVILIDTLNYFKAKIFLSNGIKLSPTLKTRSKTYPLMREPNTNFHYKTQHMKNNQEMEQ